MTAATDAAPRPLVRLEGGPCHGQLVEDSGAVCFFMALVDGAGMKVGSAEYEPDENRTAAFWVGNAWEDSAEEELV